MKSCLCRRAPSSRSDRLRCGTSGLCVTRAVDKVAWKRYLPGGLDRRHDGCHFRIGSIRCKQCCWSVHAPTAYCFLHLIIRENSKDFDAKFPVRLWNTYDLCCYIKTVGLGRGLCHSLCHAKQSGSLAPLQTVCSSSKMSAKSRVMLMTIQWAASEGILWLLTSPTSVVDVPPTL